MSSAQERTDALPVGPKDNDEQMVSPSEESQVSPPADVAGSAARRDISDPQIMRALAHPARIALMELLVRDGPLTASEAAAALDESPGNMSWHLQTLAKYGFVEETGEGKGRRRPWRLVSLGTRFVSTRSDAPELATAAETLEVAYQNRAFERLREWLSTRDAFEPEWNDVSFSLGAIRYVTPAEMDELAHDLAAVIDRFRERTMHPGERPTGARAVHIVSFGHPLPPTAAGN